MKTLYFDCYSGVSGDMILGALIDLGVDVKFIKAKLETLGLRGYSLRSKKVKRGLISATKVTVSLTKSGYRKASYTYIKKMIESSGLSAAVKVRSLDIFKRLGKAEAEVHRTSLAKVHFHEVGAVDSIVDIVGGVIAMDFLGIEEIHASPLNTGEGKVICDHGFLPVPAPATLKILKGIPCFSSGVKKELTTPTGAAILSTVVKYFGSMQNMKILESGYGAGDQIIEELPNLLRVIKGEISEHAYPEKMVLLEANIDDMNPEFYEYVMESLFEVGAVDVFITPILMKKSRPASTLSVIIDPDKRDSASKILLSETSTFGVRWQEILRETLERETISVTTSYGRANVKIGKRNGERVQVSPEYDDCKKIARRQKVAVKKVYEEFLRVAKEKGL